MMSRSCVAHGDMNAISILHHEIYLYIYYDVTLFKKILEQHYIYNKRKNIYM